jgi:hypothetical protein
MKSSFGGCVKTSIQELKARSNFAPILRRPIRSYFFQLHIDWSVLGLGIVLTQLEENI